MDWKTKLVLPPNYVTLQHLKELRMKEKSELELKAREEAEAEYKSRLEEDEERVKKLKEEEEKRRIDEEKKMKEEEEKKMREEEEEEKLKRESIRSEQINKTRTVLCGEPSRRTKKKNFTRYSDDVKEIIDKKEEIVTQEMIKDENLKEEGKKKKNRRWGKKRGKEKKEALELESQRGVDETLKSETKSSEEEVVIPDTKPKGNIYKNKRQRKSEIVVDKILMNQKVEEIEKKIGDLNVNVDDDKKMKSRAEKQFLTTQVKIDNKQHQFRIQNIQKHGIYVHNPRNASCSSLVWMPKDI